MSPDPQPDAKALDLCACLPALTPDRLRFPGDISEDRWREARVYRALVRTATPNNTSQNAGRHRVDEGRVPRFLATDTLVWHPEDLSAAGRTAARAPGEEAERLAGDIGISIGSIRLPLKGPAGGSP